ncbi:MAG: bifunctional folylpolyglutamate synthase/dihydrofolate synthase [Clostridia bacterium]|nr:bifunctional folylpolyglutamate synthase/dihydrofolate synthase [Clostridia bacterium]
MIYSQAVEYVSCMEKFGIKLGLDTVKTLLARLGDPQKSLKFLHIAGTNGKGSVSCFLTNILLASNYSVGTFNSPSVFGYNERYLFNNKPMSEDDVAKYITIVADERQKMSQEGLDLPSAFELEFAAAMLYFRDKGCDFAVLECGLGGRLDATNSIESKELAVISSISYDHTAILGDTLSKIASEKFAIVKDCPLITYRQCDEVMEILGKADDLILCDKPTLLTSDADGQSMLYKDKTYSLKQLGKYQLVNCSLAIESALCLASKGYAVTLESIKKGVAQSVWKGRLQLIRKGDKAFLLDGAHNEDGAKVLAQELATTFKDMKKCFVFGMYKDKDIDGVLGNIGGLADQFIAVKPPSPRGLDENITYQKCLAYTPDSSKSDNIEDAITMAYSGKCDLIVVCGSLSILSPAYDAITKL